MIFPTVLCIPDVTDKRGHFLVEFLDETSLSRSAISRLYTELIYINAICDGYAHRLATENWEENDRFSSGEEENCAVDSDHIGSALFSRRNFLMTVLQTSV